MHPTMRFAGATIMSLGWLSALALASLSAFAQTVAGPIYEGRSSLGAPSRSAWLERVEQARARYEAFALRARLSLHPKLIEPGVAPPARAGFLTDRTLRAGDVVVTPAGLMVFRGSRRFPYVAGDFVPVRSLAGVSGRHGPELLELQQAHERGKP